jgi:AAA+ superfamily predicted ATPase
VAPLPLIFTELKAYHISAVFLRHLEYFSGIVFLTSNRVNIFDLAMKSRIHLAIEYSPPALQMRRMIWEQCLKAAPPSEISIDLDEAIDVLIKDEVNGREIANAVNTAKTLARFEEKPLQMRHIETVLQVRRDFDASIAKKRQAVEIAESRHGSLMLNRKNSILVSREEPSQWLP